MNTNKCPQCGAYPLQWAEKSAFCLRCKFETHPMGKPMNMANVYAVMSHRIRELEEEVRVLRFMLDAHEGLEMVDTRYSREALKK